MEVQSGLNSIDEPNLLYKLQHKIKVFNTKDPLQNRGYSLVASSSKYGIVFIGVPDGTLSVYHLNQLIDKECEPQHMVVKLQESPTHVSVSCDQELLAVTGGQLLCVYKITDFQYQNVSPSLCLKTDVNLNNFVSAMQWNPCIPDSIAIAFYDGTLIAYQLSTVQVKKVQSKARCICWSPKGKQLVTGNSDGSLSQYKPDLSLAKTIPPPNLFEGSPVEALALYWISTFQFAVVYKNATNNSRPAVAVIHASKTGQMLCLNYDDICFSTGNNRPWYYYLHGLPQWNIILASSSNSMEIATFGSSDGVNWVPWCQLDDARPELPLTDKKIENYPIGLCVDTCAVHQLPWGENEVLPHMPLLLVVSQTGLLTIFNMVNLNKQTAQICSAPQQLQLPLEALTNVLPDDIPKEPTVVPAQTIIVQPKPQTVLVQTASLPQSINITGQTNTSANIANLQSYQSPQIATEFSAGNQVPNQKDIKPVVPQFQTEQFQLTTNNKSAGQTPDLKQAQENDALKAEQERINKIKVNQELKDMLIKEVNDFQMDLYKFMLRTRETQAKLQRDIESINANFNLNSTDAEKLRKECSLDDLKSAVIQLKLELVRACAVVAEARTHADAKNLEQWTQADPLTTKRVASVKKLAYYVQTQLERAQQSLDCKWKELELKEQQFNKPGHRMIRPTLDYVYQPLVKQQEILGRQQAVLRTLRNTLKECECTPSFQSTSLLRNTPFKNKDPLSKLTKNILNMSIEPQEKTKESLLTPQKIDALRDMLSNHKIIKTKPVNVELRQHLANIRKKYDDSVKDKPRVNVEKIPVKIEAQTMIPASKTVSRPANIIKADPKPELIKPVPSAMQTFTPVVNVKPISSFGNVARTLFADELKQEITKPQVQQPVHQLRQPALQSQQPVPQSQQPVPQSHQPALQSQKPVPQIPKPLQSGFAPFNSTTASAATRNVLKDLLQNKSQANNIEAKNDSNTFMGQNICSPSSFTFKGVPSGALPTTNTFTVKPISDIGNMFSKFQPQKFVPETKPQLPLSPKSNETGEPEGAQIVKPIDIKKPDNAKQFTNTAMPDVLNTNQKDLPKLDNKNATKVIEKIIENVPELVKSEKSIPDPKENVAKSSSVVPTTKSNIFNTNQNVTSSNSSAMSTGIPQKTQETEKKNEIQKENEKPKSTISKAASIFAATNISVPTAPPSQSIVAPVPKAPSKSDAELTTKSSSESNLTPPDSPKPEIDIKSLDTPVVSQSNSPISSLSTSSSSSSSIFGSTAQASVANTVFPSAAQTISASEVPKSSVFTTSTTLSTSIFGTKPPESTSSESNKQSAFAAPITQSVFTSDSTSLDASTKTEPSVVITTKSLFATETSTAVATTTTTSTRTATAAAIFASATTSTNSIFGTTTPTTQASIFGGQTSVFGSNTPTNQSVFGAAVTQSVFLTSVPSSQSSVFGTPTQTTQSSVFGSSTQSSIFGTANSQVSVFATPVQTTQASVFGTPTTSDQGGSLFGNDENNMFASASIATTSASQSSAGSIFGGGNSNGSVFGSNNTNVFGGKTTFGQTTTTAASIFGGGTSFAQKAPNNFWGNANASAGTGFGSSAFGQQPTTQSSSIFGSSGGSFSSPQATGQAFGSPQQNTAFGGGENNPSVFSSPQPSGSSFCGSGVFSGKSVFGQQASFTSPTSSGFGSFGGFNKSPTSGFGGPATFGGSPTFGGSSFGASSPGKVFGGTSPAPNFAQTQSNATFESLATQNTVPTFGNLAQQSGQMPQQQSQAFNTHFTAWRG